ncbi:MAG TPA: PspC domain-containing protein [Candidatus Paceibacterota bacterium]|jgi:phage shock protein C
MHKKLYRSREHRMVSGVLGGLGEYFKIDPVIIRIVVVLVTVTTGLVPGIIAYVVAVFMIPEAAPVTPSAPITEDDSPAI